MSEQIAAWSQNDRCRFLISESGMLVIGEHMDKARSRVTTLSPDEALDLLAFLKRHEHDIFERMPAPEPPASESEEWHQRRKEHGFEEHKTWRGLLTSSPGFCWNASRS